MIKLLVTLPEYEQDEATKRVWDWVEGRFRGTEGICYYMHPVLRTNYGFSPELTLITTTHQPVIIHCLPYQLGDIQMVNEDSWTVDGTVQDSPLLAAEDFAVNLRSKFDKDRVLRRRLDPIYALALPLIARSDFQAKFSTVLDDHLVIWANGDVSCVDMRLVEALSEEEWRRVRSIVQGVSPLTKGFGPNPVETTTLGDAIKFIDRNIALLDEEQAKAALQIAPGPQRIRGLAGTGKTVLLAMKAAIIHLKYPDRKILFTFNTQSLYNQVKALITKFYRYYSDLDPDWDYLHVRHGWGGRRKPGVYYDTCTRLGITPYSFSVASRLNREAPFQACCSHLLSLKIEPEYDFIMVDEAQDFSPEYFQVLYRLSRSPNHRIYWVYDELQNLFAKSVPTPEKLFGKDKNGKPHVLLNDDPYPGGIEKDLILHRSYRCPYSVLMLAHAVGLGLYSPNGCVQMLSSKESWESLGYIVESGDLIEGNEVTVFRPPD